MNKKVTVTELLLQFGSLFLVLFIFLFTTHELYVLFGVLVLIVLTFLIRYDANEWKVLLTGICLGILFEIAGDAVYKVQFWENGSFFGIPLWLPFMWGYGFICIRRIGNILVK